MSWDVQEALRHGLLPVQVSQGCPSSVKGHAKVKVASAQQSPCAVDQFQDNSSQKTASLHNLVAPGRHKPGRHKQLEMSPLTFPRAERRYVMHQGQYDPLIIAASGASALLEHTSCIAAALEKNVLQTCLGRDHRGAWQLDAVSSHRHCALVSVKLLKYRLVVAACLVQTLQFK